VEYNKLKRGSKRVKMVEGGKMGGGREMERVERRNTILWNFYLVFEFLPL